MIEAKLKPGMPRPGERKARDHLANTLTSTISAVLIVLGCLVVIGWIADIDFLKSLLPNLATMKMNSALGFILSGLALALVRAPRSASGRKIAAGLSLLVFLLALASLLEDMFEINLVIDQLLIRDTQTPVDSAPGRMSAGTAIGFLLGATALLLLHIRKAYAAQTVAGAGGLLAFFALCGYLFDLNQLYGIWIFSSMALHTTIAFLLLFMGLLLKRSAVGWMNPVMASHLGGTATRWLWLPAVVLTVVAGALVERLEEAGYIGNNLDGALLSAIIVSLISTIVWFGSRALQLSELGSRAHLAQLREVRAAMDEHSIVAITDQTGKITYVNDKFCDISKYKRSELLGQDHRIVNSRYHPPEFFRDLWSTIAGGRVWKGEIQNRARDGTLYWVETTIVPFLNKRGKPMQYIAIRTDITAQKKVQQGLLETTRELRRANVDLEQFGFAVSHDLQEPLRTVAACMEILRQDYRDKLDSRTNELIDYTTDTVDRMTGMIKDLLELSRVSGSQEQFREFDSNSAIQYALANLRTAIEETNAEILVENPPTIHGNAPGIAQVFQNLIANALKFTAEHAPRIEISAREEATHILFRVRDNGPGIKAEDLERIFQIFQRARDQKLIPGTGIGLAICKKIVEFHGGRIWAEAAPRGGTDFYFTIARKLQGDQTKADLSENPRDQS